MSTSFKGSYSDVIIDIKAKVFLNIDTAIPLGLLINEIVTNSFKYGFKKRKSGTIEISIKRTDGHHNFKMYISDDGDGYSEDINFKTHGSLGLKLMQKLAMQLNGSIERDHAQKGTRYILTFQEVFQTS